MIQEGMGYGLAFVTGLFMGAHCVGMCGGFVLAYVTRAARDGRPAWNAHAWYGAGKLVSYTVIGAAFGMAGAAVSFTPAVRAGVSIAAGLALVVYGLGTLGLLPLPRAMAVRVPAFIGRLASRPGSRHPLSIGLLGGLMVACGPLGAMYVLAAGTGSPVEGALLLAAFGAGTLPALVGFGVATTFASRHLARRVLRYSGLVVIVMGMLMVNRGIALAQGRSHCCEGKSSSTPTSCPADSSTLDSPTTSRRDADPR
jgi:sulfite exporter TauE/SafE